MNTSTTHHRRRIAAVVAVLGLAAVSFVGATTASADGHLPVVYTGQGLMMDGDDYVLESEECDDMNTPYLLFVLTATRADEADITIFGESDEMYRNGNGKGAWKYMLYEVPADLGDLLGGAVTATYDGRPTNAQLVLSHGCTNGGYES